MPRRPLHIVILAAGLGKRMKSATIKILHGLAGRPMIAFPLAAAAAVKPDSIVLVLGNQHEAVRAAVEAEAARLRVDAASLRFVRQERQLGTGHALLQARPALKGARGDLVILSGDVPAIRPETLRRLVRRHRAAGAAATVLTAELADPAGYGRVLRGEGKQRGEVVRIVEHRDARPSERKVREINTGIYAADVGGIFDAVSGGKRTNAQKEYYLTDMVGAFRRRGRKVLALLHDAPEEVMGVNDRSELARARRLLVERVRESLMAGGVTLLDPERIDVDSGVKVGRDTILHPGVTLAGRTKLGARCVVHPGVRIQDSVLGDDTVILDHCLLQDSRLGSRVQVGPMAHLRPGTVLEDDVKIGNFVETKKARLGRGSKANHLTYLGDAEIGRKVNVGAGTITCNYDGVHKNKTVMEDGVFIGSDTQLVAPVRVGRGAYVAAGSTITRNVPAGSLALTRVRQVNKEGWAERRNARTQREKARPKRP